VQAEGYDLGFAVGRAFRARIQGATGAIVQRLSERFADDFGAFDGRLHQYIERAGRALPEYAAELDGTADGAGVARRALFLSNTVEELLDGSRPSAAGELEDELRERCTSVAVRGPAGAVLGHNEDVPIFFRPAQYALRIRRPGQAPLLAYTYAGLLPAVGMNAWGVGMCCDSVWPDDAQVGIPRLFVARAMLAAQSIDHAASIATMSGRAGGYGHLLADAGGRTAWLETTATQGHLQWGDGWSVHTNHYVHPPLAALEKEHTPNSEWRLASASHLAGNGAGSVSGVKRVLAHHQRGGRSLCRHRRKTERGFWFGTIGSVVMDLAAGALHGSTDYPCRDAYRALHLDP